MNKKTYQTYIIFLIFALFWGVDFPITKSAISEVNLYLFLFWRFTLASIVMLPFICQNLKRNLKVNLKTGLILGLLNTFIYVFETISLHYTTVAKSAFICGANVILVPFILRLMKLGYLKISDIIAGCIFLVGLFILNGLHIGLAIDKGVIFALMTAIFIALSIIYIHRETIANNKLDEKLLTFLQTTFVIPIPLIIDLSIPHDISSNFNFSSGWKIAYSAIFATTLPLFGQIKLQKYTSATVTALIFALEPVFSVVSAFLFFSAAITLHEIVGGTIMLLCIMLPMVKDIIFYHFMNLKQQNMTTLN